MFEQLCHGGMEVLDTTAQRLYYTTYCTCYTQWVSSYQPIWQEVTSSYKLLSQEVTSSYKPISQEVTSSYKPLSQEVTTSYNRGTSMFVCVHTRAYRRAPGMHIDNFHVNWCCFWETRHTHKYGSVYVFCYISDLQSLTAP